MPRAKTPDQTRRRILDKSLKLFARKGYSNTGTAEIVAAARVNQRMIYHYFGSKKGLYRAIFEEQWGALRERFERELGPSALGGSVPELLSGALGVFADFAAQNPEFIRLLMWEGLEGGSVSRSLWKGTRKPLFELADTAIRHAQAEGQLDASVDPAHLVVSLLGATGIYFAHQSVLRDLLPGRDPLAAPALEHRKRQLLGLLSGLYKVGRAGVTP